VHMQDLFLTGGFYHLRRFTEIKVSTTSELFSTTSELIPAGFPAKMNSRQCSRATFPNGIR